MSSSSQGAAHPGGLSAPIQGALYMIAAAAAFSIMNALVRVLAESLDPLQIAFFRNAFALLVMLPWLFRQGTQGLKTERLKLHVMRAVFGLGAMILWFYSVSILPLAEAVALNFTVPLFVTIGAALILGEIVRARRWSATIIGFLGVLVIVRPGFAEVEWAMAMPIVAAMVMATSALIVKRLSDTEDPNAIVLYMNLLLTPLSLVPALFVWQWPAWSLFPLLFALGALAALSHLWFTRSYTKADVSAVMPFDYARLPFVAAIGYVAFDEQPDVWTWVGAAIIVAATFYIARREAQVARERNLRRTPADAARGL